MYSENAVYLQFFRQKGEDFFFNTHTISKIYFNGQLNTIPSTKSCDPGI